MSLRLAARCATAFVATAMLAGCGCAKGEAAERIRRLTPDQLAAVHALLASMDRRAARDSTPLPAGLAVLQPRSVQVDAVGARIHLAGCGDDKVMLFAVGLDPGDAASLRLDPGEAQPSEILWSRPATKK